MILCTIYHRTLSKLKPQLSDNYRKIILTLDLARIFHLNADQQNKRVFHLYWLRAIFWLAFSCFVARHEGSQ